MTQSTFDELRGRLAEIADLNKTGALLGWDQHVMMPARGAGIRAEQLGTIGRIAHTKFTDPEIGRLLDSLRDWSEAHEYDSFEASLIRVTSRDWDKARRVSPDLRAEMSRSAALANPVWGRISGDLNARTIRSGAIPALTSWSAIPSGVPSC